MWGKTSLERVPWLSRYVCWIKSSFIGFVFSKLSFSRLCTRFYSGCYFVVTRGRIKYRHSHVVMFSLDSRPWDSVQFFVCITEGLESKFDYRPFTTILKAASRDIPANLNSFFFLSANEKQYQIFGNPRLEIVNVHVLVYRLFTVSEIEQESGEIFKVPFEDIQANTVQQDDCSYTGDIYYLNNKRNSFVLLKTRRKNLQPNNLFIKVHHFHKCKQNILRILFDLQFIVNRNILYMYILKHMSYTEIGTCLFSFTFGQFDAFIK